MAVYSLRLPRLRLNRNSPPPLLAGLAPATAPPQPSRLAFDSSRASLTRDSGTATKIAAIVICGRSATGSARPAAASLRRNAYSWAAAGGSHPTRLRKRSIADENCAPHCRPRSFAILARMLQRKGRGGLRKGRKENPPPRSSATTLASSALKHLLRIARW